MASGRRRDMLPTFEVRHHPLLQVRRRMSPRPEESLNLQTLSSKYARGEWTPAGVLESVRRRIEGYPDRAVWIDLLPAAHVDEQLAQLDAAPGGTGIAAVRRAVRGEGQHRRRRPPHHGRLPGVRLRPAAVGGGRAKALRRRRDPGRQDQPRPVRDGPGRRPLAVRRVPEPVRPAVHLRGFEFGVGGGGGGGVGRLRPRHRHRGLGPRPGGVQQRRRAQAVAGAAQHVRRRAGVPVAGLRLGLRPDVPGRATGRGRRGGVRRGRRVFAAVRRLVPAARDAGRVPLRRSGVRADARSSATRTWKQSSVPLSSD